VRGRVLTARTGEKGDVIVVTRVEVPLQISDAERELWQKLASQSQFHPRQD
jgi:curved DNA-binding protein